MGIRYAPMLALGLAHAVTAASAKAMPYAAEEVVHLPGWGSALPSRMYSGFVNISLPPGAASIHYWYIESENNPDIDPTILWSNGGPGATSMFGILVELGPFLVNEESLKTDAYEHTGIPTLFSNKYSWSRLGSLLMFDWPPPVGFSFCGNDTTGDGYSCGDWDDERMAGVTYAALAAWYLKFPHRRANDLYLTGESYAGIYIPKLAQQILKHADPQVATQLKGFAVGDGCLGTETEMCGGAGGPWFTLLFLYGHGQISNLLYERIVAQCGMDYLKNGGAASSECLKALALMHEQAGGYFAYGLYDDCIYQDGLRRRRQLWQHQPAHQRLAGAENDYVCGGGPAQNIWVNHSAVRRALNVPLDAFFFEADNGDGMVYKSTEPDMMPFYRQVASTTKLRMLVYNGDTDPDLNSFRAENWTAALGFKPTQPWRPWTVDGCLRMGGYVTRYEEQRFDFLTIRGSGHMVPEFKPAQAFEFLRAWLADEDYKPYVKGCKQPNL